MKPSHSFIIYKPLQGEVDYKQEAFPFSFGEKTFLLPTERTSDPYELAHQCKAYFENIRPYILIPGIRFDRYGTRYGKGGGWYDRFLAEVPRSWFRIGILKNHQLSETKLMRKPWDQPMDALIVYDDVSWNFFETPQSKL